MLAGSSLASCDVGVQSLPVSLFVIILSAPLGAENPVQEMWRNIVSMCMTERHNDSVCIRGKEREFIAFTCSGYCILGEYNYMCTLCPVLSLYWREANSSLG